MKTIILVIAIVLAFLGGALSVRFAKDAQKSQQNLNEERYSRMVAEENLSIVNAKVNGLETELERLQNKLKNTEKLLSETDSINSDLKARLDKVMELKDALEQKIKELQNLSFNRTPMGAGVAPSAELG